MPAGYQPFYAPPKTASGDAIADWIVPRHRKVAGLTLGEWGLKYWGWLLRQNPDRNPTQDTTGAWCGAGQDGPVWFLAGADARTHIMRECRIPRGKYVMLPAVVQLWFPKTDELAQDACAKMESQQFAKLGADSIRDAFVVINGERFEGFADRRPYSTRCANIVGDRGETIVASAMQYGAWMMLYPLPSGIHEISFGGSIPDLNTHRAVTYRIRVE
jgi:hypothetical protein